VIIACDHSRLTINRGAVRGAASSRSLSSSDHHTLRHSDIAANPTSIPIIELTRARFALVRVRWQQIQNSRVVVCFPLNETTRVLEA